MLYFLFHNHNRSDDPSYLMLGALLFAGVVLGLFLVKKFKR